MGHHRLWPMGEGVAAQNLCVELKQLGVGQLYD